MKKYIISILGIILALSIWGKVSAHNYAMTYLFGGTTAQYINQIQNTGTVLNNVSPDYFEINPNGSLKTQKIDSAFINYAKGKGITVTPFISNHWDRALGVTALNNREALSTQIADTVNTHNLDGVNVDIENVTQTNRDDYTDFVRLLRSKMKGKIVTVAVAANPGNWQTGWHGSYDYTRLASYSDYLMIMGYDESYYGGPPGPVASSTFSEKSILYALGKTAPDKIVLGVPFFGRYWKEGSAVGGSGVTSMDVKNLMAGYTAVKTYYNDSQSAKVMLTIKADDVLPKLWGGTTLTAGDYEIWYDDLNSTEYKLKLVDKYDLLGSGSWASGQDVQELWPVYAKYKIVVVTGVKLSASKATIKKGKTKKLTATVSPAKADNKSVIWKSSNPKIAKVSTTGTVTGVKAGKAAITAVTNDGSKKATCAVTVVTPVTRIKMITKKVMVGINKTKKLKTKIYPANASNKKVSWKSANKSIAKVTKKGVIRGIRPGRATITVTTVDGKKKAKCTVTVKRLSLRASKTVTAIPVQSVKNIYEDVISNGWISQTEFHADTKLSRAQAVKTIMRMATNLPDIEGNLPDFSDTAAHPDGTFIKKAKNYGIVTGNAANLFNPENTVTKYELVLWMDRVFSLPDTVNFESHEVKDNNKWFNPEAYYAINKYIEHKIIIPDGQSKIHPRKTLNIGEFALIIERLSNVGIKDLKPLSYEGQKQPQRIISPR